MSIQPFTYLKKKIYDYYDAIFGEIKYLKNKNDDLMEQVDILKTQRYYTNMYINELKEEKKLLTDKNNELKKNNDILKEENNNDIIKGTDKTQYTIDIKNNIMYTLDDNSEYHSYDNKPALLNIHGNNNWYEIWYNHGFIYKYNINNNKIIE